MNLLKTPKLSFILILLVLLIASAAAYLPLIGKIGFSNDDWYLMYDAHVAGPQIFHDVFNIDRPARAYLQIPLFVLFGENVIPYHISLYLFRLAGAVAFFWILYMVWPGRRLAIFSMSLLFLIYPGFLAQTTPIDYQAHIFALFLGMLSIALSIKALLTSKFAPRIFLTVTSILLGVAYLSLMEYFIGLEVFRLMLVVSLVLRNKQLNWRQHLTAIFRKWFPFLTAPIAFLVWRLFFFQSERKATNVGAQMGQLFGSPIYKGLGWLIALFQDSIKIIFLAWAVPLYNLAFQLRLRDLLVGLALATFIALIVALFSSALTGAEENHEASYDWKKEAWIIGLVSVLGGLLPVIISNRQADFASYSRYTLTSSAGAVIVVVVLLSYLESMRLRTVLLSMLVGAAILTHYANSVNAANNSDAIRNFWWQVFWRAPQLRDGTTLAINYPEGGIAEDYFIWGPASFIYSPEKQSTIPISVRLAGIVLTQDDILRIIIAHGQANSVGRGNVSVQDFANVTVIAQSTPEGCIRMIDGSSPELSSADAHDMMLIAPRSKINNVVLNQQASTPPSSIFGAEPQHGWCYYFEKAELARQQGNWQMVDKLGDEALNQGLYPSDRIEWMPFLQSYVVLGELDKAHHMISIINSDSFTKLQACQILSKTQGLSVEMQSFVQQSFCQ
ncbi:MAG: hypothetical protein WBW94_03170 [Anaerolineales bacterium]